MDMNYVDSFDLFGVKARQKACKPGTGAPTTTTEGAVGDLYMDTRTGDIYKCTAVTDGVHTWESTRRQAVIVEVPQDQRPVSLSASEIYDIHLNDRTVLLKYHDYYFALASSSPSIATFIQLSANNTLYIHCVDDDGNHTMQELKTGGSGVKMIIWEEDD